MSIRMPMISRFKTQLDQMSLQYERAATLQVQVSTGKKIQRSSDDPRLATQIQSVQDYLDRLSGYQNNIILAQNRLSASSAALQQATNIGVKVKQLLVEAQNQTLNNDDRAAIAIELNGLLESMFAIANTQDGNGEYLFNGVSSGPAYLKNGSEYVYQGTYDGNFIAIDDNTRVQYNQSGFSIFGDIKSGTGLFSVSANSNNTGSGQLASVNTANAGVVNDPYTITMVTNSSGKLAYQIVDDATGLFVVPILPADAPEYISGNPISFNGINTQLSGEPALGDSFSVTPSTTQNVFKTIQNVINALNMPISTPQTRAAVNQIMTEQASSFNNAFEHLIDATTKTGFTAQQVDIQMEYSKDIILQQKTYLSSISDIDLPATISTLSLQLTSLEMTQQTYTKLQEFFTHLVNQQF